MKLKMTIDECIAFADEWSRGMTYHEDSRGWRVVCMLLAEEVRRLQRASLFAISADYGKIVNTAPAMPSNAKVSGAGTASAGLPGYASAQTQERNDK